MSRRRHAALLGCVAALAASLPAPAATAAPGDASGLAASVVREVNRQRARHRLPALRVDAGLVDAAGAHSRDMARHGFLGHASRDGEPWQRRVWRHIDAARIGETVAWVAWPPSLADQAVAVVAAWMASPSHRADLLSPAFARVGVALARGRFAGGGATFFTADLAG